MRRAPFLIVPLVMILAVGVYLYRSRTPSNPTTPERPTTGRPLETPNRPPPPRPDGRPSPPSTPSSRLTGVRVSVFDANRLPIAEARVRLLREPEHEWTEKTTDAAGQCEFLDIRPGEWVVGARHRRHILSSKAVTAIEGTIARVEFVLDEGARVEGTVTDGSGRAVPEAAVLILDPERKVELSPFLVTRTDERGYYELEGIPLRTVGLGIRAKKFRPLNRYDLLFSVPGETRRIDVALDAGTSVSGRVSNELGRPVANAFVSAGGIDDFAGTAASDAEGRFTVYGLGDRPVSLAVSARGYGTVYLRNVPPNTHGLEVRIARGATISGRVDPAVEAYSVLLHQYVPELGKELLVRTYTGRPGSNGAFTIPDVAEGTYSMAAGAPGFRTVARVPVSVRAGEPLSGIVLRIERQP